jgi:cytochrome c556
MSQEKQIVKRLTFASTAAERSLLDLADELIASGEYASFNDLCKTALHAFLHPAALPQPAEPAVATPESAEAPMLNDDMASIQQELVALHTLHQESLVLLDQLVAQTPAAPVEAQPAQTGLLAERLLDLEQRLAELKAEQPAILAALQSLTAQVTTLADTPLASERPQLDEQMTQQLLALQSAQQELHAMMQHLTTQVAAITASTNQLQNNLAEQFDDLHTGQQAVMTEMQQVRELLLTEIAKSQPPVRQPVPNGEHKSSSTQAPFAEELAVSPETVNRLARFLEDF